MNYLSIHLLFQGGTVQVRFQPRTAKYLAAASETVVNIIDVETFRIHQQLQVRLCLPLFG